KNRSSKLRSFARCCREDNVPVELAVAVNPSSICSGLSGLRCWRVRITPLFTDKISLMLVQFLQILLEVWFTLNVTCDKVTEAENLVSGGTCASSLKHVISYDIRQVPDKFWVTQFIDKVDKSIRKWRGRKCFVVIDWCDLKGVSGSVFGSSKSSEEIGVLQNVHRNLVDWIALRRFNIQIPVAFPYRHPSDVRQDLIISTNRAFTASSTIPSIYIQQFWDIVRYDKTVECYKCQIDEQWFDRTKDTLRDALQITPINNNKAFYSPPSSDALINFVNDLGYLKVIRNLSNVVTNDMFQPWRALTKIINLCLTGKTSGFERPRAPVLQILLGRKHKFHPRPDSPLHLPNEEPVLGYLKFNAKGTKRKVFGMPIPGNLITADIQGEPYYQEYVEKVAKHQRYLAGEKGSDPDSPAPKPAKATKTSKPSAPKADLRPPVIKPASSQQPEPKPAPAKSKGKKRKLVTETSDKPSPARRSKPGLVTKRRKPTSSLRLVDESVNEGIPEKEPRFDDEEADVQRALKESLKSIYDASRGPLPPVVIREPESGNINRFQRFRERANRKRTSTPTGSSGYDESSSLYAELRLTDSDVKSDEDVLGINAGVPDEGQTGPNPGKQDEGQAGPNPGEQDLEATDVSTQPHLEQMDEGFTATAYPKVQENLKLMVKEHVILKEPASSTGTLSSL
nr:E-beta-farnesene synthase [Tanacetum cinerariifolium]